MMITETDTPLADMSWQTLYAIYNDTHKDAYGFRPTGLFVGTGKDLLREIADLSRIAAENAERERAEQDRAAIAFEARIADTIASGAGDRATALRWIHEAEGTNGDDGYLEYTVGIRYGYIKETV